MSKVAEHLKSVHETEHAHHTAMAAHHGKIAAAHDAIHKSSGMSDEHSPHKTLADSHHELSKLHKAHAEFHQQKCAECAKAATAADLAKANSIAPTHVSAVGAGDMPQDAFGMLASRGIRAVPRAGSPTPSMAKAVQPEFAPLAAMADDDRSMA